MKHLACADLIPHCTAEFRGADDSKVVTQYAAHARKDHPEPIALLRLLRVITAA